VEGGGTLAAAFLSQGLVDEFHRFQSELPAHGPALALSLPAAWRLEAAAHWLSGRWEVWR
jgi:dihydrofolate reductase